VGTGWEKLRRDEAPVPVPQPAGETRCSGATGGQLLSRALCEKAVGMGTQDKSCLCHQHLDTLRQIITRRHGFPDVGSGEKSTGSRSQPKCCWRPRSPPLLPAAGCCRGSVPGVGCGMPVGTKAFPTATGSREPHFGSQSTNEQHGRGEGTRSLRLPTSFPPCKGGEQGRSEGFPRTGWFAEFCSKSETSVPSRPA